MYYYNTPNYSVALNAKVGSSSMARAIIKQFCPRENWLITTAAYPEGSNAEDRQWHWMVPGKPNPDKPVVLLVRDPIDRFISACQQVGIRKRDVSAAINSLFTDSPFVRTKPEGITDEQWAIRQLKRQERAAKRQNKIRRPNHVSMRIDRLRDDVHFLHQHKYAVGPTHCFRFPRDIAQAASFIGITTPMPEVNKAKREKPKLSTAQEIAVRAYYAEDQELFDAITQAGYVYTPSAS